jgi:hypothetical protein
MLTHTDHTCTQPLHHTTPAIAPTATPLTAAEDTSEPLWEPLALLLEDPDDPFVSAKLPELLRTYPTATVDTIVEHPQVLARLCAMRDVPFLQAVLTLAQPDHGGQPVLFLQPVMARIAALAYHQYQGAFLRVVRTWPGFDARAYDRYELRPYRLRHSAQQGASRLLTPLTGRELLALPTPPLHYIVEDILPPGACLFVGRAKDGKSLAVWNLLIAVATGGKVFGQYQAAKGPVLYLDLEDGKRRAKQRYRDQLDAMNETESPDNVHVQVWDAPRIGEGLEEALEAWLDAHEGAKLIVIDILERIRPPRSRYSSAYADDYNAVAPLQRLAQKRNIAIVIVHHVRKAAVGDFRDAPSGAMSLLGGVDTLWNLQRAAGDSHAVFQMTGRELSDQGSDLAMVFADGFWTVESVNRDLLLNAAHHRILDTLRQAGTPMTPTMLATELDINLNTMKSHLRRMTERGTVCALGEGLYTHLVHAGTAAPMPDLSTHETPLQPTATLATTWVAEAPPADVPVPPAVEDPIVTEPIEADLPRTDTAPKPVPVDLGCSTSDSDATRLDARVAGVAHPDTSSASVTVKASSNGHPNGARNGHMNGRVNGLTHGHRRSGMTVCAHVWTIEGHQGRCERCGVCCPIKG